MIKIRTAQLEDTDDLKIINNHMNAFLRKFYRPTKAGYANKFRISDQLNRLVALVEDKVVGTSQYYFENNYMRILGIAVHEDYRCQGIARMLIKHILELSKQKECTALRLSTVKETGNVLIFEQLGFKVIRENTDDLADGINGQPVTDVEMEMRLTTVCSGSQGPCAR